MKNTFLAKPNEVEKKWYIIDAKDKPLGRVAATAATVLRGKHRPTFTPNVDCGDNVIIINAAQVVLTGKKLDNKFYYRHTGYIGGRKQVSYRELLEKNPEKAMMLAIKGMLPHNKLGNELRRHVFVYEGPDHPHAAQKPVELKIKD